MFLNIKFSFPPKVPHKNNIPFIIHLFKFNKKKFIEFKIKNCKVKLPTMT
jgi:hypothetical protein